MMMIKYGGGGDHHDGGDDDDIWFHERTGDMCWAGEKEAAASDEILSVASLPSDHISDSFQFYSSSA